MHATSPLLVRSWARSFPGENPKIRTQCLQRWSESHRYYHTLEHLTEGLELLEFYASYAQNLQSVELAWWYHDLVYDPTRTDNETRSAAQACLDLGGAGAPPDLIHKVERLILCTRDHNTSGDIDANLLSDVDLAILGAPTARFQAYQEQIRREYSWVPEPMYTIRRREILASFLARDPLYQIPAFESRFGTQARINLAAAL